MSCVIVHSLQSTGIWCVARVGLSLTTGTEQERLARSTSKSVHYCLCIYNMYIAASGEVSYIMLCKVCHGMQCPHYCSLNALAFVWKHVNHTYPECMIKSTHYGCIALLQALDSSFSSICTVCVCNIEKVGVPTYYTSAKYTLWLYCHYRAPCVHVSIQTLHSHNTFSLV